MGFSGLPSRSSCVPLPYTDARKLFGPAEAIEQLIKPNTLAIHMWHSRPRRVGHETASGRFLSRQALPPLCGASPFLIVRALTYPLPLVLPRR